MVAANLAEREKQTKVRREAKGKGREGGRLLGNGSASIDR